MYFLFYFSVGTLFVIEMTGEKCPNQPEFPYFQNSYIPDIFTHLHVVPNSFAWFEHKIRNS